ncbi:MAG TPA: molybdenum cofactor biosynthesis protein MoaE [Bacteroidota bacterium]|nr:molybdenum cofactor biosynthesis protein MoaE [Bacteroidota bacterium]
MIVTEPIDLATLLQQAHRAEAGAVVLFSGEVRNNHKNKSVNYLEYEAYIPMAETAMEAIVQQAIQQWQLQYAAAVHRIGKIKVSESAVAVITAHAHRNEAYEANQYIIERIKSEVPIWKCEHYTDGTHEWGKNERSL